MRKCTAGFTLVELVVVLSILAVLAAVAAPRFVGRQGFEARGFFDASAAAIRYAQKTAIAKHRLVYVVVAATTVAVCYDAACAGPVTDPATGGALQLSATRGIAGLSSPVAVAPATTLAFNGLGQPVDALSGTVLAGDVSLTFTPAESGDVTRTLVITAETGYVRGS